MLVVIDNDLWERPAGQALLEVLNSDVPGLPQPENMFRVMHTNEKGYDATMKLLRNIIVVKIGEAYSSSKLKYERDVYASPQIIMTIQSPDEESFAKFVTDNREVIVNFFDKAEINRQIRLLQTSHNQGVLETVKQMFDCEVWVSSELTASKKGENFYWVGTNAATADRNYVIYSFPYTDQKVFTDKAAVLHKRDSVMQINIPGAQEGMYMATDTAHTAVRPISVHGDYAFEVRGLWRVKGDMMGGPFVSHVRLDTVNQKVIVQEIFVYSPDKLKRNYVRQMEASLYTLRLPGAQAPEEEELDKTVEHE